MEKPSLKLANEYAQIGDIVARARSKLIDFTLYTKPDYEVSWHHFLTASYLDKFARGEIKRLMIFMPPRHGKSELVSRRLPAFLLGCDPNTEIIACSYGADLASRMNRDVQRIMDDNAYRSLFPESRLFGKNIRTIASGSWLRNSDIFEIVGYRGVYRSTGVGGAITGMGAKYLLIDDPIKSAEEAHSETYRERLWNWLLHDAFTRLEKDAGVLLTVTRWHEDDLPGRILAKLGDGWVVLNLPAIAEDPKGDYDLRELGEPLWANKFSFEQLMDIKKTVGSYVWNALYQQRPAAADGLHVKREWFKFYRVDDLPARFDKQTESWDLTFKGGKSSDYCVGDVWGRYGADHYLIFQLRKKLDFPGQCEAMLGVSRQFPHAVGKIVEETANGAAVIATLKHKVGGIIPYRPKTSKEDRLRACSPTIEAGNVWLPHPDDAPWINDWLDEVCGFPSKKYDDRVDTMTQYLIREQDTPLGDFLDGMNEDLGGATIASNFSPGDKW